MEKKKLFAWSPIFTKVVVIILGIAASAFLAGMELSAVRLVLLLVLCGGLVVALGVDEYGGIVVGVLTATVLVLIKRFFGQWDDAAVVYTVALGCVSFLAVWLLSAVSQSLRAADEVHETPGDDVQDRSRIASEHQRARTYQRDLSLILVAAEPTASGNGESSSEEDLARARAEIDRYLAAIADPTDIRVALDDGSTGLLLVEKDTEATRRILEETERVLTHPTLTLGAGQARRAVTDLLAVRLGASTAADASTADAFVSAARPSVVAGGAGAEDTSTTENPIVGREAES